jgi:hypothetical protein
VHSTSGNRGRGGGCSPDLVRRRAPWRESGRWMSRSEQVEEFGRWANGRFGPPNGRYQPLFWFSSSTAKNAL